MVCQVDEDRVEWHVLLSAFVMQLSHGKNHIRCVLAWPEATLCLWKILLCYSGKSVQDDKILPAVEGSETPLWFPQCALLPLLLERETIRASLGTFSSSQMLYRTLWKASRALGPAAFIELSRDTIYSCCPSWVCLEDSSQSHQWREAGWAPDGLAAGGVGADLQGQLWTVRVGCWCVLPSVLLSLPGLWSRFCHQKTTEESKHISKGCTLSARTKELLGIMRSQYSVELLRPCPATTGPASLKALTVR